VLSKDGDQRIIVFASVHDATRDSEAIGPFDESERARLYAELISSHGSIQPSLTLLRGEEPRLQAPDPELLAEVAALMGFKARLEPLPDEAQPRIFPSELGYRVPLGHGEQIAEYAVTAEGESMGLPRGGPSLAVRDCQVIELPAQSAGAGRHPRRGLLRRPVARLAGALAWRRSLIRAPPARLPIGMPP